MLTIASLMVGLTMAQAATFTPVSTGPIAPRRAQPLSLRRPQSSTSRVREWTFQQRRCDKGTEGRCVSGAPDLVRAEADKPRD